MNREEVLKALAELKETYGSTDDTVGTTENTEEEEANREQTLVAVQERRQENPAELEVN